MNKRFLNIPEEVALLALDEEGDLHPNFKSHKFDVITASAILMDLALNHRIDTDQLNVIPDKLEPMGDELLDEVTKEIKEVGSVLPITDWISRLSLMGQFYRDEISASLVKKGVLKIEDKKVLWVFSQRKYPIIDDTEVVEVSSRIRNLVFSDDIPDPKDIAIVSLIKNADLLDVLFTDAELKDYSTRINTIAKMDMIGLSIGKAMDEFKLTGVFKSMKSEDLSPVEKLDAHINGLKEKYRVSNSANLPEWIRKGSPQYEKTLEFVEEKGTADITYNHRTGTYQTNNYTFNAHGFGEGS